MAAEPEMNAAGDDEKRTDRNHETQVFEHRMEHPIPRVMRENIIRRCDRRETETKPVIVPLPMMAEDQWRESDRKKQNCKWQHDERTRVDANIGHREWSFEIGHALRNPSRASENILAADLALLRPDGYCIPELVHRSFIRIYVYIHVEPVPTIEILSRGLGQSIRAIIQSEPGPLHASIFIELAPEILAKMVRNKLD